MKFEKNNRYFNLTVYIFLTVMSIILATLILLRINLFMQFLANTVALVYLLLEPLIIGFALAYLIDPIVNFYDQRWCGINFKRLFHSGKQPHLDQDTKKRWPTRTVPTLLTFLTLMAWIGLFVLLIQMNLEQVSGVFSIKSLKESLANYMAYFEEMILNYTGILEEIGIFEGKLSLIESIYQKVNQFVVYFYTSFMTNLSSIGLHAMNWLLALVIAFYFLQDKAKCLAVNKRIWQRVFKKHYKKLSYFIHDVDQILSGYIRGEVLDSIIMMLLTIGALMLIQLDFAIIIGIISGIFNLIPYFGPIVGFALAIIIGLLDPNPMKALYGATAIIIIQQIDGWIIVPNIVGECVKLHPIVVLLAILIGGNLFGLIGMLLAVPVAALIRLIFIYLMPEIFSDR